MRLVATSDEINESLVNYINRREEKELYIKGEKLDLKLIRNINKDIYSLSNKSPLRRKDLKSLNDSLVLSNKEYNSLLMIFKNERSESIYLKSKNILTNKSIDTSKYLKSKKTSKEVFRTIPKELLLSIDSRIPTLNKEIKLIVRKDIEGEMEIKLSSLDYTGNLNLTSRTISSNDKEFNRVLDRFSRGTLFNIEEISIKSESLPEGEYNNKSFNSIIYGDTEPLIEDLEYYINNKEVGNIYVKTNEMKEKLSSMGMPKIMIKLY